MIHFREAQDMAQRCYDCEQPRYQFEGKFDITMADWPVGEIGSVDQIKAKQIAKPPKSCYLFNFPLFDGGIGMFSIEFEPKMIKIERVAGDMDDAQFDELLMLKRAMS